MKVYVAGKNLERARSVMDTLKAAGYTIVYDWVAFFAEGPTQNKAIIEQEAVRASDLLVYLWEPDQESARYEAGMAMGLKMPVIVLGKSSAFFFQIPNVYCVDSETSMLAKIQEIL